MKRIISILLTIALLLCLFSGCVSPQNGTNNSDTITITDHLGNVVTLPANIERIAVCDILPLPSVLSVFFDSADKIVAMAPSSMSAAQNSLLSELYPEILEADTSAVSGTDVNTEELMKLDPQVVFYSASNPQLGQTLTKAGFNAVAISAEKWEFNAIETLNQWIDLLGQIFPGNNRLALVRKYSEESLDFVNERINTLPEAERQKVFFLFQYDDKSIVTSGKHFFGQWWADTAGAVNVGGEIDDSYAVKVTLEQVYKWNPDIILMTNYTTAYPDDLYNNTVGSYDWSGISAVENSKVYKMPLGMYRSYTPGADTPITLFWMAKTIYPELFSDVDITEKTIDYYKTVFDITLTSEQAKKIFAPESSAGQMDVIYG